MMFFWEPQMVSFMQDACENSSYHYELASRIKRYLPAGAHVCDAGCGLGYLSLELSKFCRHVSAIDIAPQALRVLRKNAVDANCGNISIIEGDISCCPPDMPYDAMVFSFFGDIDLELSIARSQCSDTVILIKKNWAAHRFSLGEVPVGHNTLEQTRSVLQSRGIRFICETFAQEMGQPLHSMADAVRFFRTYSKDEKPQNITEEDIRGRLVRQQSEQFPYYLPCVKNTGIIVLHAGDIPDGI